MADGVRRFVDSKVCGLEGLFNNGSLSFMPIVYTVVSRVITASLGHKKDRSRTGLRRLNRHSLLMSGDSLSGPYGIIMAGQAVVEYQFIRPLLGGKQPVDNHVNQAGNDAE